MMDKILVTGSTSHVGRALTGRLAQDGEQVRAATRDPLRVTPQHGVEPVRFDYGDPSSFRPALEGTDAVFLVAPPMPAPHAVMIPFVEAATRDERRCVLMTAMGTEFDDSGSLRQVERALEKAGKPWVIIRPNWFMDNLHTSWADSIAQADTIALPAADARTSLIDARDIADCAAAALRSDRFDRQEFTLTGPSALTYEEVAGVLSQVTGRTIRYKSMDEDAFVRAAAAAGTPTDLATYLARLFVAVRDGATASVSPAVTTLTGQSPRTLVQYARDHASAWSASAPPGS